MTAAFFLFLLLLLLRLLLLLLNNSLQLMLPQLLSLLWSTFSVPIYVYVCVSVRKSELNHYNKISLTLNLLVWEEYNLHIYVWVWVCDCVCVKKSEPNHCIKASHTLNREEHSTSWSIILRSIKLCHLLLPRMYIWRSCNFHGGIHCCRPTWG